MIVPDKPFRQLTLLLGVMLSSTGLLLVFLFLMLVFSGRGLVGLENWKAVEGQGMI